MVEFDKEEELQFARFIHPLIPNHAALEQAERYFRENDVSDKDIYENESGGQVGKGIYYEWLPENDEIDLTNHLIHVPFKRALFDLTIKSENINLVENISSILNVHEHQRLYIKFRNKMRSGAETIYRFFIIGITDDNVDEEILKTKLCIDFGKNYNVKLLSMMGVAF